MYLYPAFFPGQLGHQHWAKSYKSLASSWLILIWFDIILYFSVSLFSKQNTPLQQSNIVNYHSFISPLSPIPTSSIFPRHYVIVHLNRTSLKTQHPEHLLFRKSPWQCLFIWEILSCFPLWLSKYNATRKWLNKFTPVYPIGPNNCRPL